MSNDVVSERELQQREYMQKWLQHAPKPPDRGGNTYDVFISYRSSDRAWAMALYDALRLAGWEPFLDQYDLVPGSDLETSLSEGLEASSSGVILWSSRTKDSEWCKRERNAMRSLKDGHENFHYVFAKLDAEPLPLFARADLYLGFEDSPEGPRGANLLRLMSGMKDEKLAPVAVELAQEVDESIKEALATVAGALEAGNPEQLVKIGSSMEPGVLASPGPVLAAAQGLISMKKDPEALDVLRHAQAHFPKSVRATQLEGLALRRLERFQESIEVLSKLKAAGHQDPETLGILAAAWDGRYRESGKTLYLRKSREMYRTAFLGDPTDYYTGINAASKSLFLGEVEEAERLATKVLPLVQSAKNDDLWASSTLAEVYLLRRQIDEAASRYQTVIDHHPTALGDLSSTRKQAERICAAHNLSDEEAAKVLSPFVLLDE